MYDKWKSWLLHVVLHLSASYFFGCFPPAHPGTREHTGLAACELAQLEAMTLLATLYRSSLFACTGMVCMSGDAKFCHGKVSCLAPAPPAKM